jgi:hypothetical protein
MMIEALPIPLDLSRIRLREGDEEECKVFGFTPEEAIRSSSENDRESFMVCIDGEPAAFWGYQINGFMSQVAYAWLLTTPAIEPHKTKLARASKRVVDFILEQAPVVVVMTHLKYEKACRWLAWLGFTPWGEADADGIQYMIKRRG